MTNEGKSITEKWVESKNARYAYAFDKGGKLQRRFGVRGIPHAILVDPTGTVRWRGHPMGLDASTLEGALEGALKTPLYDWPSSADGVKKALLSDDLGRALDLAGKLGDEGADITASVEGMIAMRTADMNAAFEAKRYFKALTLAEVNAKAMAGLPGGEEAQRIVDRIQDDPQLKKLVKGQEKLAKLEAEVADIQKKKDADKLIKAAEKLASQYKGTVVADQATELAQAIGSKRRKLKR